MQAALAKEGISKNRRNSQGAGYNFRGIDDVFNAISPLLAENHICILPRVVSRECVERQSKSGGALFYTFLDVEFDFVSSEDGSKHTVRTVGEAMDSGDKSSNKAMSAAYKYAALQTFAIPTEGDNDADAHTHQVKPAAAVQATQDQALELFELFKTHAKTGGKDAFSKMWAGADKHVRALIKADSIKMKEIEELCEEFKNVTTEGV